MNTTLELVSEKTWEVSHHAIEQFIDRNPFIEEGDYRTAEIQVLSMMDKATFICYDDRHSMAEIYSYKNWVFCTKESTIVTVYQKSGSRFERMIS